MNSRLIGKVPVAVKDWGRKEKRASEDEMAGWHHRCNGHELGQTSGEVRDRETLNVAVHGVKKSQTQPGNWTIAMLPMANLTSHSRMSIIRWVATPIWLFGSLIFFKKYSSFVYFCYFFLMSSVSVRSFPFLSFIVPILLWNVPLIFPIFLKWFLAFPILLFQNWKISMTRLYIVSLLI